MPKPRYTAIFERDAANGWLVELAENAGVRSYGRTLAAARDGIWKATAVRLDHDDFDVQEEIRLPVEVAHVVATARTLRAQAIEARDTAQTANRTAAQRLVRDARLGSRDAAEILGMSPARIQQFLRS